MPAVPDAGSSNVQFGSGSSSGSAAAAPKLQMQQGVAEHANEDGDIDDNETGPMSTAGAGAKPGASAHRSSSSSRSPSSHNDHPAPQPYRDSVEYTAQSARTGTGIGTGDDAGFSHGIDDRMQNLQSDEDDAIKLGLGDFVFYSVLVSRAALSGFGTAAACFVAIIMGLVATLVLLAVCERALPALPISIFFGVIFYFCTALLIEPFAEAMSAQGLSL